MQQCTSRIFAGTPVQGSFRLMSYNTLAGSLIDPSDHTEVQLEAMQWSRRWPLISQEVLNYKPDVLCMQEMDDNENDLSGKLKENSYDKLFLKRSLNKMDGCAIFYNTKKFQLLETLKLEFYQPHISEAFLDRPNVCLFAVLKEEGKAPVTVACTHLLFNLRRGDIKMVQFLLIQQVLLQLTKKHNGSTVLCGDFNLIPRSPIYNYITRGQYNFKSEGAKYLSGQELANFPIYSIQNAIGKLQFNVGQYSQKYQNPVDYNWVHLMNNIQAKLVGTNITIQLLNPGYDQRRQYEVETCWKTLLPFRSVYAEVQHQNNKTLIDRHPHWSTYEPMITTMSKSTTGCVDYILVCGLQVAQTLQMPSVTHLLDQVLPNAQYPSDHLPLVCDLY